MTLALQLENDFKYVGWRTKVFNDLNSRDLLAYVVECEALSVEHVVMKSYVLRFFI